MLKRTIEPAVQMHVSLPTREQIAEALWKRDLPAPFSEATDEERWQYLDYADAVLALLSQLTPTATCGETRPHDAHEGDRGYGDEPDIDWVHWTCPGVPAKPPRIEDLAPGTPPKDAA